MSPSVMHIQTVYISLADQKLLLSWWTLMKSRHLSRFTYINMMYQNGKEVMINFHMSNTKVKSIPWCMWESKNVHVLHSVPKHSNKVFSISWTLLSGRFYKTLVPDIHILTPNTWKFQNTLTKTQHLVGW